MADARIGIKAADTPTDYVDNSQVVNDLGQTVMRQRVEAPDLFAVETQLLELLGRMSTAFAADVRLMVKVTDQAGTVQNVNAVQSGTWNITTLTTLTNQTQVGGYLANPTVFAQMSAACDQLYDRISVS